MIDSSWIIKLLFSALFSALIGVERQYHGRPAGLRTHMLVSLGATVITLSGLSFATSGLSSFMDIGRLIAGIVTGIGFLGAGAIVRTSDMVRGLTTAACIWFIAAIGVVTGLGLFWLAAFSTAIVLLILTFFTLFEDMIPPLMYRDILVAGGNRDPSAVIMDCSMILKSADMRIQDSQIEYSMEKSQFRMLFHTRTRNGKQRVDLVKRLSAVDGVSSVTWLRKQEGL